MISSRDKAITGSLSAKISLLITEKNGSTRIRTISMVTKSYPDGSEKRSIKFLEPADVKGTSMLITDNKTSADEMWIFLPALNKTRRIVSTERGKNFMSSEFTNADMSSPAPSDFTNMHAPNSGENNTWVIESIPADNVKVDEYGYSKKISYIGKGDLTVKKIEFYNFENKLFKILEIRSVQPLEGGRYLVKDMLARNLINGRSSEMKMDNIAVNARIDDSIFSLQNLGK
jgi:hypothetical protein